MEERSLKYIAEACDAEIRDGAKDLKISGISTDSRSLKPGELFVAIQGDKFDGHSHLEEVAAKKAAAAASGDSAGRA